MIGFGKDLNGQESNETKLHKHELIRKIASSFEELNKKEDLNKNLNLETYKY